VTIYLKETLHVGKAHLHTGAAILFDRVLGGVKETSEYNASSSNSDKKTRLARISCQPFIHRAIADKESWSFF